MNRFNITITQSIFFTLFLFISIAANSQNNDRETVTKNLLQSKNYVFQAHTVLPTRGVVTRPLSFGYDMQVVGDSIITYLPYFGRAYAATYDAQGGIKFSTTEFDYKVKEKNKGWEIIITPNNVRDVRQMILSVSKSGYATLQVTSNFRDPITFRGEISKRKTN